MNQLGQLARLRPPHPRKQDPCRFTRQVNQFGQLPLHVENMAHDLVGPGLEFLLKKGGGRKEDGRKEYRAENLTTPAFTHLLFAHFPFFQGNRGRTLTINFNAWLLIP